MDNRYLKTENTCNYMNKIVLTFIISIFLFTFVAADGDIGLVKQYDCIQLYNYCPTCTYMNITTIQYPDGSIDNMNEVMTKDGMDYNYSFCDTEIIGKYSYTTCGDKAGVLTCEDISFEVTPSGTAGTLGFTFIILILSLGIMAFGFYLSDPPIVILSSFGLYFVGLYTLFNGIDGIKDPVYTWAIGIIVLMLAAYVSIRSAYELITD